MIENAIELYQLSPQQQRIWALQTDASAGTYFARGAMLIEGRLDRMRLEAALAAVVDRHEILRTSFHRDPESGEVGQAVNEHVRPRIHELRADIETAAAFDLTDESLLQTSFAAISESEHVLSFEMPSLCSDATGLFNLMREVVEAYDARPKEHDGGAQQYADLAEWQHELLDYRPGVAFWERRTYAPISTSTMPFERRANAGGLFSPAVVSRSVDHEIAARLRELSHRFNVPLSLVFLACWHALLGRLSGQPETVVGVEHNGRSYEELNGTLGLFAKYLPIGCRIERCTKLVDVVRNLEQEWQEAGEWQEYFDWKRLSSLPEDVRDSRYFPFAFDFRDLPTKIACGGLQFRLNHFDATIDRSKLRLSAVDTSSCLIVNLNYDSSLFSAAAIEQTIGNFQALLSSAAADTGGGVRRLNILTRDDETKFVSDFNQTGKTWPDESFTHELIERQAAARPGEIAIVSGDRELTFADLKSASNQLAHYLRQKGVGPDMRVGIFVERSVEMMIALIAVLKAGGAYVPLDPAYPEQRLAFMLRDAQVALVLTQTHLRERVPASSVEVLCVDANSEHLESYEETAPPVELDGDNLAYVIYTSGSTGQPKGTMITHRGLSNYLKWAVDFYQVEAGSGAPIHSSLGFDLTVTSLFAPLLAGRSVMLPGDGLDQLEECLSSNRDFSFVKLTPAHLEALNNLAAGTSSNAITRVLIVGGEALSGTTVSAWRAASTGTRIINEYGPTETVVGCCIHEVSDHTDLTVSVPIGRPIANAQLYVLDEEMFVVPATVIGELYIGGVGLARGYVSRPDVSAEKFVPNPFSDQPGSRLYRTGDLARYLPNGEIDFLGRADHQVKLRGYRIEPGEIEAVLLSHPQVNEAVVVAREDESRLLAYIVPPESDTTSYDADVYREYLRERLPEYMIPSAFVRLQTLPLTANGKVDRDALPTPSFDDVQGDGAQTAVEEIVAGLYGSLLGIESVSRQAGFFDLGGHSLLATQLVSRIREVFQIELPLRAVFEAPTVKELARRIEGSRKDTTAAPLLRVDRDRDLPLSFAQQRLWFLEQLEPGSSAYNIATAMRVAGDLNTSALERSLTEIVRRHEVLRTRFVSINGEPRQVIDPPYMLSIPLRDLGDLNEQERERDAQKLAVEEARKPFDLEAGPLVRASILRLSDNESIVLFTMHHIVSDGWSSQILKKEIGALYGAYAQGLEISLPEPTIQYADYAAWQRERLQGSVLDEQLGYWREQLAGAPAVLDLPIDRPRPPVQRYNGALETYSLAEDLSSALSELCRREGVTLYMLLLAAFNVLLSRYSGQHDICVGTSTAGRSRRETEDLIGFFINTLVLRTEFSDDPEFRVLLSRVRETCLEAYSHQDVPFEKLVDELQPQRTLSHTPLFQVLFELHNAVAVRSEKTIDLALSPMYLAAGTAKFDIEFAVTNAGRGLSVGLEYNTDLFDARTMRRFLEHWRTLLEEIVADPDTSVSRLQIMTEDESATVVTRWNDTAKDFPLDVAFIDQFERQVEVSPDAIAVACGEEQLTYRELDDRARSVAGRLIEAGIMSNSVVGLLSDRGISLVVAVIGTLKAGAAYLPLDPGHPTARLADVVGQSRPQVILCAKNLIDKLNEAQHQEPESARTLVLPLEEITAADARSLSATARRYPIQPNQLAYVIYTSGSTGKPKGVMVEQRGMLNHLYAKTSDLRMTSDDVVAQTASQCFDISVWQMLAVLLVGGRMEVFVDDVAHDSNELARHLVSRGVTICETVPSLLSSLIAELKKARSELSGSGGELRWMIATGEALPIEVCREWLDANSGIPLLNAYGPTECSDDVTHHVISDEADLPGSLVPIGRPVANTQLYIVDRWLMPVPIGVRGELVVGGIGVGRGYWEDPGKTAEMFVPDPFGSEPGSRLYRTGDLTRYLADGRIEFLGRIDQQVKVRGYRIELGEIEAALQEHPEVREAVVMARDDLGGDKRLVAYVVASAKQLDDEVAAAMTEDVQSSEPLPEIEPKISIADWRRYLQKRLPEYMVPAAFVWLKEMPLNPSGKIDRKRLPAPHSGQRAGLDSDYTAPETDVEKTLAGIFASVLGVGKVGVDDNFFELGGDSILSIQIVARASQMGLRVTVKQLFQYQTIAELSQVVGTAQPVVAEQGIVVGPVPLTPIQQWFLDQDWIARHHYNQALMLAVAQPLDPNLMRETIRHLLSHHDALRLRFSRTSDDQGGVWNQHLAGLSEEIPFRVVDLSGLEKKERRVALEKLAAEEQTSLDLEKGPLLRVVYFEMGEGERGRLLLVVHHLAVDGVSWRILLEDLQGVYGQLRAGEEVKMPAKTSSFRQWSERLTEAAQEREIQEQAEYWYEQSEREVRRLPLDAEGSNTVATVQAVTVSLNEEETRSLLQDVPGAYRTQINEALLTALVEAVGEWTGEREIKVEMEGHGREDVWSDEGSDLGAGERATVDVTRTVGWFTSSYPVVIGSKGEKKRIGERLKEVKEQVRGVPQRGVSYGMLRYLSEDEEIRTRLGRGAGAEISFNYLGQFDQALGEESELAMAPESSGPQQNLEEMRSFLIDINSRISGGRLVVSWSYSPNVHERSTIERLAESYIVVLRNLIEHCKSDEAGGYTPSDFAAVRLEQRTLDSVLSQVEFE